MNDFAGSLGQGDGQETAVVWAAVARRTPRMTRGFTARSAIVLAAARS